MPYVSNGTLTTDKQQIDDEYRWDTDAEWGAYQSRSDVAINNGVLELVQSALPDSFEDGDLDGYAGETGSWTTTTSVAQDGTVSATRTANDQSHRLIYWDDSIFGATESKEISAWFYYDGGTARGGPALATAAGAGYVAYAGSSKGSLNIVEFSGPSSFSGIVAESSDGAYSLSSGNWYQILISHDGADTLDARMQDASGNTLVGPIGATATSHDPTTVGLEGYDTDVTMDNITRIS